MFVHKIENKKLSLHDRFLQTLDKEIKDNNYNDNTILDKFREQDDKINRLFVEIMKINKQMERIKDAN